MDTNVVSYCVYEIFTIICNFDITNMTFVSCYWYGVFITFIGFTIQRLNYNMNMLYKKCNGYGKPNCVKIMCVYYCSAFFGLCKGMIWPIVLLMFLFMDYDKIEI